MIRTWSLLLRCCGRQGFTVAGREPPAAVGESPFLLYPIEQGACHAMRLPLLLCLTRLSGSAWRGRRAACQLPLWEPCAHFFSLPLVGLQPRRGSTSSQWPSSTLPASTPPSSGGQGAGCCCCPALPLLLPSHRGRRRSCHRRCRHCQWSCSSWFRLYRRRWCEPCCCCLCATVSGPHLARPLPPRLPPGRRAHNLCYSTLLHKEDVARLPPEHVLFTPTGALPGGAAAHTLGPWRGPGRHLGCMSACRRGVCAARGAPRHPALHPGGADGSPCHHAGAPEGHHPACHAGGARLPPAGAEGDGQRALWLHRRAGEGSTGGSCAGGALVGGCGSCRVGHGAVNGGLFMRPPAGGVVAVG